MLADLPVSVVAFLIGWKYVVLADLWIIVVGTLWWYLLSYAIAFAFHRFSSGREAHP